MSCAASREPRAAVVVLAGGSGRRLGAVQDGAPTNKTLLRLSGRPVLLWSLHTAAKVPGVRRLLVVVRPQDREAVLSAIAADPPQLPVELVDGGSSRHASESAGIAHVSAAIDAEEIDVVAVHDAARPLASAQLFSDVLRAAASSGGAIPSLPAGALVAHPPEFPDDATPDQADPDLTGSHQEGAGGAGTLVRVQTPQAFRADVLRDAFRQAAANGFEGTDTSSCVERYGAVDIVVVPGAVTNLKVTYPDDVAVAAALLAKTASA